MSCDNSIENSQQASDRLSYFKDDRTGLCFCQILSNTYNSYNVSSITCVPCDSIPKELLK